MRQFLNFITMPFRILLSAPAAVISAPQRLMGMALPTRVAILVAIFLVTCTIVAYTSFLLRADRPDWGVWVDPQRVIFILILLVVIPFVVQQALRLWMEGDVSRFPDIDFAWKEGLAALQKNDIDPSSVPIFLVVGARDEAQASSVFAASRLGFRVRDLPAGKAALHWYASPDAIYVVCTEACRLGRLSRKAADMPLSSSPRQAGPRIDGTLLAGDISKTMLPGNDDGGGGGGGITGTMQLGGDDGGGAPPPSSPRADLLGTMQVGAFEAGGGAAAPAAGYSSLQLTTGEAAKETARLEYVCSLMMTLRQNLCPMNGILALLPFDVIQLGDSEGKEIAAALKEDLNSIRDTTQLRCSVTTLVVGMETEPGFSELVRRVGADRASDQRFGKGSRAWTPPMPDLVEAVSANACAGFEAWVYQLFREKDGLTRPGNTDLYSLLIKIRQVLRNRLTDILVEGCASATPDRDEPLLFSGCYFAATGETADRQAFVHSVFRKVEEQQNELAWTGGAERQDGFYRQMAWAGFVASGLLAAATAAMFFMQNMGGEG